MNEESCVVQSIQGDEEAFGSLMTRYNMPIRNFIYRLVGDYHYSQDLAQETFVKAFRSLPRLEAPAKFRGWLFKIAFHVSIDWRRAKGERMLSLDSMPEKAFGTGEEKKAVEEERRDSAIVGVGLVVLAIRDLPIDYSILLYLFYFRGVPYRELARALDITRANVKIRLFRARKMLREYLREDPLFIRCCEMLALKA